MNAPNVQIAVGMGGGRGRGGGERMLTHATALFGYLYPLRHVNM